MASKLSHLAKMSRISADTADLSFFNDISLHDATTNPSLVLASAETEAYQNIIAKVKKDYSNETIQSQAEAVLISVGQKILEKIPGQVSTEIDARLSFDTRGTIDQALRLINGYEKNGTPRERVLIKIAATWQGIEAAKQLEAKGIMTNLTLIFHLVQAAACAEAQVTIISPFVGRILDWYQANEPDRDWRGKQDPGVASVSQIFHYLKFYNYKTKVLAASFRNTDEIEQLAGCDLLTLAPKFIQTLNNEEGHLVQILNEAQVTTNMSQLKPTEAEFLWMMNDSKMASHQLAEGIRRFAKDQQTLEDILST